VGVYVVFGSIALASADHEKGFLNGMRVLALYLCGFVSITTTPRCGARTRSGNPCRSPTMPNGRCRIHGGTAPGAPKGNRNAVKHGFYSAEIVAHRRKVAALLRAARKLIRAERESWWLPHVTGIAVTELIDVDSTCVYELPLCAV
jgi:hypothetical protein